MAGQRLTVRGLAEGSYDLQVNGVRVIGGVTADELAHGYLLPGSYSTRGQLVHDLTQRKENNYYTAWREVRLPLHDLPGMTAIVDGLMQADDAYHTAIEETAHSEKLTLTLTPRPAGANLAEGKPYTCSDPNAYNWGLGGLTDGNWESSPAHCFASGDADAFPKTVTIDLQTPALLGAVIAGVPHFGSTKTINVSVSLDGAAYTQVGSYLFSQHKEERHTFTFDPRQARYVRLSYPDHYTETVEYGPLFVFTTEAEVYAAKAAAK